MLLYTLLNIVPVLVIIAAVCFSGRNFHSSAPDFASNA